MLTWPRQDWRTREFRAVVRSYCERRIERSFQLLLQGGKKNGRRFGCDGTRSRPQDQAARLGFRSVGPFPLPFCSILSFLLSWPASEEQRRDEREKERSANHRTGSLRGDPREYHLAMGKKPFHGFYHY